MFHEFIFCIFACDTITRYKDEIHKIEETWGQEIIDFDRQCSVGADRQEITDRQCSVGAHSAKLLFFLGDTDGPLSGDNYIRLENVGDDYLSAADKQYLGIKYVYENYDFHYLYICGTDTYVLFDNLQKYVRENCDFKEAFVMGGHGDNRQIENVNIHFFAGGAGMVLTKPAVQLLYPRLESLQSDWRDICVANNYISYIPACDASICYFLKQLNVRFLHAQNRFFNCNYLGYNNTPRGVYECCTKTVNVDTMIACHNMSPSDFDNLFSIKSMHNIRK